MSESLVRAMNDLVDYVRGGGSNFPKLYQIAEVLREEMRTVVRRELRMLEMQCDDHEMVAGACLKDNERLVTENGQLLDMLRLCHADLDPGSSFDEWIEHLQWLLRCKVEPKAEIKQLRAALQELWAMDYLLVEIPLIMFLDTLFFKKGLISIFFFYK